MLFAFHLIDRPDAGDLRQRIRPEHKVYLSAVADRIAFAGPLTRDDGHTMLGSLLVIDFESTFYFHREGPGLLFGMGDPDEAPGFDTTVRWDFLPKVTEVVRDGHPRPSPVEALAKLKPLYKDGVQTAGNSSALVDAAAAAVVASGDYMRRRERAPPESPSLHGNIPPHQAAAPPQHVAVIIQPVHRGSKSRRGISRRRYPPGLELPVDRRRADLEGGGGPGNVAGKGGKGGFDDLPLLLPEGPDGA